MKYSIIETFLLEIVERINLLLSKHSLLTFKIVKCFLKHFQKCIIRNITSRIYVFRCPPWSYCHTCTSVTLRNDEKKLDEDSSAFVIMSTSLEKFSFPYIRVTKTTSVNLCWWVLWRQNGHLINYIFKSCSLVYLMRLYTST